MYLMIRLCKVNESPMKYDVAAIYPFFVACGPHISCDWNSSFVILYQIQCLHPFELINPKYFILYFVSTWTLNKGWRYDEYLLNPIL